MPHVDYLLVTHDHWDRLDYPTVTALQGRRNDSSKLSLQFVSR